MQGLNRDHHGAHPPAPSSSESADEGKKRLLTLVRRLEKDEPTNLEILEQIVEALSNLTAICKRQGLLQGNTELAEKILASSTSISQGSVQQQQQTGNKRRSGKRRRKVKDPQRLVRVPSPPVEQLNAHETQCKRLADFLTLPAVLNCHVIVEGATFMGGSVGRGATIEKHCWGKDRDLSIVSATGGE